MRREQDRRTPVISTNYFRIRIDASRQINNNSWLEGKWDARDFSLLSYYFMNLFSFSLPVNKNALRFKFKLVKDSVWVVAGSQQVHVLALGLLGELISRVNVCSCTFFEGDFNTKTRPFWRPHCPEQSEGQFTYNHIHLAFHTHTHPTFAIRNDSSINLVPSL